MVTQTTKLHLGCGLNTPDGWINVDGSWNARLSKYPKFKNVLKTFRIIPQEKAMICWNDDILIHDVRKRLPFKDNYFSAIYASHLLEHLYLEEAKSLLQECLRVLMPFGILRMVVPDLKKIILEYIEDIANPEHHEKEVSPADELNNKLLLRTSERPSGNIITRIYSCLKDFHSHKWMYDTTSLIKYFKWAGFSDVREMQMHQSRIEDIEKIEIPERVLHGAGICIEGIKPN